MDRETAHFQQASVAALRGAGLLRFVVFAVARCAGWIFQRFAAAGDRHGGIEAVEGQSQRDTRVRRLAVPHRSRQLHHGRVTTPRTPEGFINLFALPVTSATSEGREGGNWLRIRCSARNREDDRRVHAKVSQRDDASDDKLWGGRFERALRTQLFYEFQRPLRLTGGCCRMNWRWIARGPRR